MSAPLTPTALLLSLLLSLPLSLDRFLPLSGSYLPAGYSFPSYGGKVAAAAAAAAAVAGEEGEKLSRSSPTVKPPSEAKALELLQQHASQYKSKSPSVQDKAPHERERDGDRPRSSPSQRILPSHHHLGYPLLSGQYDLSYASGEFYCTEETSV